MRAWSIVAVVAALAVAAHASELEDKVAKPIAEFKDMMPVGRADLNIPALEPISIKQLPLSIKASPSNSIADLETTVKDLSESFRDAMKKGNDDFAMAAMDPVVFSNLSVHFHKWFLDGQVLASDVQVSGASDFELTNVTALDTNKVALEITIPALSVQAGYALDAKINLGVKVHSKNTGTLGMTASDVKCTATAELVVDNDGQLRLASFDVNFWGYGKLNVHVENPTNAGFIKKSINSLIAKLVPSLLVKPHKDDLATWASSSALRVIGHFVDGVAGRIPIANLDEKAATLLESLRSVMETGSKDLGLPVLDPFYLDELSFPVVAPSSLNASVVVKNFKVSKNSYFIVSDVTQAPESNRVTFVLDVPVVEGNGSVDVAAVYAGTAGEKAASSGDLTAQIEDLKITASAVLAKNANGAFQLRQLTIDSWTYGEVAAKVDLKNYYLQTLLNRDISYALYQIFEAQKAAINTWAETSAKAVLDQYLAAVALPAPLSVHLSVIPAKAREIILRLAALAA